MDASSISLESYDDCPDENPESLEQELCIRLRTFCFFWCSVNGTKAVLRRWNWPLAFKLSFVRYLKEVIAWRIFMPFDFGLRSLWIINYDHLSSNSSNILLLESLRMKCVNQTNFWKAFIIEVSLSQNAFSKIKV